MSSANQSPSLVGRFSLITGAALLAVELWISFWSLSLFPSISVDETGFVVSIHTFLKTGKMWSPVSSGLVHPDFELLAGAGGNSLRGIYFFLMGKIGQIIGFQFYPMRLLSWSIWVVIGTLLFLLLKKRISTSVAFVTSFIWISLFDTLLASHLIRPDIWLALALLLSFWILTSSLSNFRTKIFIAGFISAVAAIGIHLNALTIVLLSACIVILRDDLKGRLWNLLVWLSVGVGTGMIVSFFFADFENMMLDKFTFHIAFFNEKAVVWKERLNPLRLLGDSIFCFARPASFYFSEIFHHPILWITAGFATFFSYALSVFWIAGHTPKPKIMTYFIFGFILVFFTVGYGHIRPEIIYNTLATLMAAPLIAYGLVVWANQSAPLIQDQLLKSRNILAAFLLLSSFITGLWFFATSFIAPIVLVLLVAWLEGATDKKFLIIGASSLLMVLACWVSDASFMASVGRLTWGMFAPLVMKAWAAYGIGALLVSIYALKRNGLLNEKNRVGFSSLFKFTAVVWFLFISIVSAQYHQYTVATQNIPLQVSLKKLDSFLPPKWRLILAPHYVWFPYKDKFRDLGALITDYYYSGQNRTAECLARLRPDILVIDDEFKRRNLLEENAENGTFHLKPLSAVVSAPYILRGQVSETFFHSQLDIYQVDWR